MKKNLITDLIVAGAVFLLTLLLLMTSCKHEPPVLPKNPDDAGGNGGNGGGQTSDCDPNTVYFQNDILPLLQSNCASSNCHDADDPEDGVQLTDFANIVASGEVQPGDPGNSELFEVLVESDPDDRMPPAGQPQLTQQQINLIYDWIAQGAQNNFCTETNCDTSSVTYAAIIAPLIQSKCVGCHNASSAGGGIQLTNYTQVKAAGQSGELLGSVLHQATFSPMPKGGAPLPACDIAKIRTWIREGYTQ